MKRKRNEKPLTDEEKSRAADLRLRRLISRSATELISKDPDAQRQAVVQIYGYHLPDEVEKSEKEILVYINERTLMRLKENNEFTRTVVEANIRKITEKMGLKIEEEERRKKPPSIDDYIERAKKFKELKEVMGVKEPGWLSGFADPKVITALFQLISEFVGNKQAPPNENVVLVSEDGEEREITRQEYEQLKAGGNTGNPKDMEGGEPIGPGSGSDTIPEPETSDETKEKDGATGGAGSDN